MAPQRPDGTLRNPVTIWVVRLGDNLYVRSYKGSSGAWFRGAQVRHEGHIRAGGIEKDVAFVEEADPAINDQIDAAYRTKYSRYLLIRPRRALERGKQGIGKTGTSGQSISSLAWQQVSELSVVSWFSASVPEGEL